MTQWIRKLKSIKANKVEEIPKAIRKIKKIFQNMDEAKANMTEKEKLKYFINILPEKYKRKLVLKESTKVDNLYDQIKEDLTMWNNIDDLESDKSTYNDDPLEIDYAGKLTNKEKPLQRQSKHNNYGYNKNSNNHNNNKHNNNKNYNYKNYNNNKNFNHYKNYKNSNNNNFDNKFCEICDKTGHTTKEWYFNPKNPRSKYHKYYNNNEERRNNNNKGSNNNKRYIDYIN